MVCTSLPPPRPYGAPLLGQEGKLLLSPPSQGRGLIFPDPSGTLSPNTFSAATKIGVAYQPIAQFEHYLDLIRNEKPISVTFRPEDSPPTFVVYCAGETPGEGEM